MQTKSGYEIERKFLIAMPCEATLHEKAERRLDIKQTYLLGAAGESVRIRKITENEAVTYIKTVKKRISAIRRMETETEVTEAEYIELLKKADPERRSIEKVRYCVPHGNHMLEIDVFPFWTDKAFLEVELSHEGEAFVIPPDFTVLREVTEDSRYTNASLARNLPE